MAVRDLLADTACRGPELEGIGRKLSLQVVWMRCVHALGEMPVELNRNVTFT